jgi:polygalacturonase
MIDGTLRTTQQVAPDQDRVTGRIKLGTESNGGYRNVRIEDCRFTRCRGLALETVDGGVMEQIVARRLTMREVTTAPLFLRLGDRRRGPEGTGIGSIRDVQISEVDARGIDHRFPAALAGLPGHPIRNVVLRDVHLAYAGGGSRLDAERRPAELADAYPEPSMFGVLPSWALWARHVDGLTLDRFTATTEKPDARPPLLFDDVARLIMRDTPLAN